MTCLEYDQTNRILISGSANGEVFVWAKNTSRIYDRFMVQRYHFDQVTKIILIRNWLGAPVFITSSMDKQVLVWRAKTRTKINEAIFELTGNNKQGISDMAYNHRTD